MTPFELGYGWGCGHKIAKSDAISEARGPPCVHLLSVGNEGFQVAQVIADHAAAQLHEVSASPFIASTRLASYPVGSPQKC